MKEHECSLRNSGEKGRDMKEVIRKILVVGTVLMLSIGFQLLVGCNGVKETPQTQTIYTESSNYGQVSMNRIHALQEQYPEGFYKENEKTIAADDKISIGISPFKGGGALAQVAEQATEVFSTIFVESGLFLVVEREKIDRIVAEVELNQSGLINSADSLKIGKITSMQLLLFGNLSVSRGRERIDIKVVDIGSGEVVFAKKMDGPIDADSSVFLARQVVKKLAEQYYSEQ